MEEVITTVRFYLHNLVLLELFFIKDYNILNVGRYAPYKSYIKSAEHCMSLLNIGLKELALEREDAGVFETEIKSCKAMKALSKEAQKPTSLKVRQYSQQERKLNAYIFYV